MAEDHPSDPEPQLSISDILKRNRLRFVELLTAMREASDLSQKKFADKCKAEHARMIAAGELTIAPGSREDSISQPMISRLARGEQWLSPEHVIIMMRVLRKRFASEELADTYARLGAPVPEFSRELERHMTNLAGYEFPDDWQGLIDRADKMLVELQELPSLIKHKERRFVGRRAMNEQE
ncbi:MAG TPA: hypothetical protein VNG90_03215 [Candidatus Acidoferrum sp.]|nr:hypothetical protein [Candidatus Acidoferrum sp.]